MNIPRYLVLMHFASTTWGYVGGNMNIRSPDDNDPRRPAFFSVEKWPKSNIWPDFIQSSTGICLMTSKAVEAFDKANLTGFKFIQLPELRPSRAIPLNFRLPDQLWILTPTGRVIMKEDELYETCLSPTGERVKLIRRFVPELKQPNAKDLSLVYNTNSHTLICTQKVFTTVRDLGWKNIRFSALDLIDRLDHEIDPTSKKWPPQWYPDGVAPHPNNVQNAPSQVEPSQRGQVT